MLEFNARFGDPETQVLMPRIEGDLLAALSAAAHGDLAGISLAASGDAAVTVVLAAPDYPDRSDYAGFADRGPRAGRGGRRTRLPRRHCREGRAPRHEWRPHPLGDRNRADPRAARERAYAAVDRVSFEGVQFRRDIAAVAGG